MGLDVDKSQKWPCQHLGLFLNWIFYQKIKLVHLHEILRKKKNEFVPKRWRLSRLDGIAWTKSPEVVKEIPVCENKKNYLRLSELPPAFEITRIYGIIYHTVLWIWKDYAFNFFLRQNVAQWWKNFVIFLGEKLVPVRYLVLGVLSRVR